MSAQTGARHCANDNCGDRIMKPLLLIDAVFSSFPGNPKAGDTRLLAHLSPNACRAPNSIIGRAEVDRETGLSRLPSPVWLRAQSAGWRIGDIEVFLTPPADYDEAPDVGVQERPGLRPFGEIGPASRYESGHLATNAGITPYNLCFSSPIHGRTTMATGLRVHLDHLINRQSLRYRSKLANVMVQSGSAASAHRSDSSIRFDDIRQKDGWFDRLVKPDFQRATCAWDPEACVTFLNSVVRRRIIPSIILWRSSENGLVYVLDGAHRLSVLRAWMIDDWGDKAGDFYEKNENLEEIQAAAQSARALVRERIGLFTEFEAANAQWIKIAFEGGAPRQLMLSREANMAMFYSDMVNSSRTLHAQWEDGDYEAAEESFLAINRQGERLDDVEQLLIEHRNGSLSRVIMSIASAGASGHYWPEPHDAQDLSEGVRKKLAGFNNRCGALHHLLFVPPFDAKILDLNVPFVVAPGHFRPHQHLIELLPLLTEGGAIGGERLPQLLAKDSPAEPEEIILNADQLLTRLEKKLGHLGGKNSDSLSLSVVPLIYWYNRKANFVRGLFYGWCHWLLSGDDTQVQERKIAVSAIRGELEEVLIRYKDEIAEVQHRSGAGLKSLGAVGALLQKLAEALLSERELPVDAKDEKIRQIVGAKPMSRSKAGNTRSFSKGSRIEINVRELLSSAIKCEICGGVVDLKQGLQYDHKHEHAKGGLSVADNGRPTHPFCNLFRDRITQVRSGASMRLPNLVDPATGLQTYQQLRLFDSFPGE